MLRPTFMGFETAQRAIRSSQKGIDIAGNNSANWNTPGYTRQRMDQVSVSAAGYRSRYASSRVPLAGQGTDVVGIGQIRDTFLDKRYRDEAGGSAYYDQKVSMLTEIEDAISEYDPDNGMMGAFGAIDKALGKFMEDTASETNANNVASSFKSLTLLFRQFDQSLSLAAEGQKYNLKLDVADVNSIFSRLADLNGIISGDLSESGSPRNPKYGPNELLDERNLLLDQLSQYGDIDVADKMDGSVTVKMNGHTVVEGKKHEEINFFRYDSNGTVALRWQSSGADVSLTKGTLKASLEIINGRGRNVTDSTESVEKGVPYYRDKINTMASTLAGIMNNMFPERVDEEGNAIPEPDGTIRYRTFLGAKVLDEATGRYVTTTDVQITAANISISDEWSRDSSYIILKEQSTGTNSYVGKLKTELLTGRHAFSTNGETFTGTFSKYIEDYALASLGEDVTFNEGRRQSHAAVTNQMMDARDSVSAVDTDEETTAILMFNKTFQAAARLMNTLDEQLDTIINKMGLVGR